MDLDSIINEFSVEPETGEESVDPINEAAEAAGLSESLIDEIFAEPKEEPAEAEPKEEPAKEAKETTEDPKEGPASFETASKNVLFNDAGELDTVALQDKFISPGKSFLNHVAYEPPKPEVEKPKVETPEEKYNSNVNSVLGDLPSLIAQDKEAGYTAEQTLVRLQNTLDGFGSERDATKRVHDELAAAGDEYKSELEQVKTERRNSKIAKNTAELSSDLEGFIPGVSGLDTLNHFMLDKNLGGPIVNHLFMRDNPNHKSLNQEEKQAAVDNWYEDFQANKNDMAIVAHVGKLEFIVSQMPAFGKYAQKIGASKQKAVGSTAHTSPSDIQSKQSNGNEIDEGLGEFLGFDSVN